MRPATTHSSNILLLRFRVLCVTYYYFFLVSETFKFPWFLVAYMQYVLLIPPADIFSPHIWRLKGVGGKLSKHNPLTKKHK